MKVLYNNVLYNVFVCIVCLSVCFVKLNLGKCSVCSEFYVMMFDYIMRF